MQKAGKKKWKVTITFQFLEKFYKSFIKIQLLWLSKHLFIIKEQLCQSFWQLVMAFRFDAKKIGGGSGGPFDPPWGL